MSVFNRDLVVQLLNKILGKADLTVTKTDEVLGDTKKILTAVSGGMGAVKSVQRGTARFTGRVEQVNSTHIVQVNTLDIKINKVNPAKCVVLIDGLAFDLGISSASYDTVKTIRICVSNIAAETLSLRTVINDLVQGMYDEDYFVFDESSIKVGDLVPSTATFGWQLIEYY